MPRWKRNAFPPRLLFVRPDVAPLHRIPNDAAKW